MGFKFIDIMEEFTEKEKQAIAGVLSAIIYADGFVHEKEVDFLARINYMLDISNDTFNAGIVMVPTDAFDAIAAMTPEQRKGVGKILLRMVYADGELNSTEYEIFTRTVLRCGIELEE